MGVEVKKVRIYKRKTPSEKKDSIHQNEEESDLKKYMVEFF